MALIQGTASVSLIVGSSGNNTFSRNRGGNYTKPRKKSYNPRSTYQQNQRGIVSAMPALWRALNDSERSAWNETSSNFPYTDKIGNVKYYSGYNLFCKFNINLSLIGESTISEAPSPQDIGSITGFIVDHNHIGSPFVKLNYVGNFNDSKVLIFASNGQSAGVGVISKSTYLLLGAYTASDGVPVDLSAEFSSRNLIVNTGERVFFKAYLVGKYCGIPSAPAIVNSIFV